MSILTRFLLFAGSIAFSLWAHAAPAPLGAVILDEVDFDLAGNLVEVQGRVGEAETVASLDVNGIPVAVGGEGDFVASLPISSIYAFNLYRESGVYHSVEYAPVDSDIGAALQLVVGEEFLQKSKLQISRLLTNIDLVDVLQLGDTRCAVDTVFLLGCDFYIRQLLLRSEPIIEELYFQSNNDGESLIVNISGRITDADLRGQLRRFLFGYRDTTVNVRNVDFSARFEVIQDDQRAIRFAIGSQGALNVRIGQMRVTRSDNFLGYLLPYFKAPIEFLLSSQFARVADTFLARLPVPVLPETIALDVTGEVVADEAAALPIGIEAEFALPVGIESMDVIGDGDVQVRLGGSILAVEPLPGRSVLGTRLVGAAYPVADAVDPPTDLRSQISVDFINRLLAAIYQSGIDQRFAVPLNVDDFGDITPQLLAFGVPPGGDVQATLTFGGLPEVSGNSRGIFPVGVNALLPSATVELWAPVGDSELLLLSIVGDFYIDTSLAAQNDGRLQLDFDELVEVDLLRINGGVLYEAVSGLPEELLFVLLEGFVPVVVGELGPFVNQLLNSPRLDLELATVLSQWLSVQLAVPVEVSASVTEAEVAEDASSVTVGIALEYK